jgi:two-component system nitrate/nitrite response regulator NarL
MTIIHTCIIEQNDLIREGIKSFLSGKNYKIYAEFKCLENFTSDIVLEAPQLIIIGINTKILSGYNAQEEITKFKLHLERMRTDIPHAHLIILISQEALFHIPDLYSWNVDGYICRDITKVGFLNYLNLAMMGEKILPPPFMHAQINGNFHTSIGIDAVYPQLHHLPVFSLRENDIIRCIAQGSPNKKIASQLKITESTVKVHLKTILRKLGMQNRTQVALWATKNGFNGAAEFMAFLCLYSL